MMIGAVSMKYAMRSLRRHTRRTLLSIMGTGVGCSMALVALSWMTGVFDMEVKAIAESGAGHLCIVQEHWLDTHEETLRVNDWKSAVESVEQLPSLDTYSVRAHANGLLAFGNRTAAAQFTAVLPEREYVANRIVKRSKIEGRYLKAEDTGAVVIGRMLAHRLKVQLDDDLYVTLSGSEDIYSAMFRIVGIMDTGSRDLDLSICHVTLQNLEDVTGIAGAGQINILLDGTESISAAQAQLETAIPEGNKVVTWREMNPAFAAGAQGDVAFMRLMTGIVVLVVALGIMSAQLTAVMERRREFAMLVALGMKRRQIIWMVMVEAVVVGFGGALVALIIGGSGAWYLAYKGVSLEAFMEDDLGFGGILFDPWVYGSFGSWLIGYALAISLATTILATLYPAWKAAQVMPADALRTTG